MYFKINYICKVNIQLKQLIMALIDDFLESVTDEFGNKIDFSNIEVDGFEGVICFGENYAEIDIKENSFWLGNYELFESQKEMLTEFVNYVHQKMKESREYFEKNKIK